MDSSLTMELEGRAADRVERMKVLHITNWYPNASEANEALFIRRHIQALSRYCGNEVIHLQFAPSHRLKRIGPDAEGEQWTYHWEVPTRRWRFIEWMTSLFLRYLLHFRFDLREYDVVNFHVAYPLCTWTNGLKRLIQKAGVPMVITEHWTAYHFNFHLPWGTDKLDRIRRIFHHGIPLITVSKALKEDIERFSGKEQANARVVPNVVDTTHFHPYEKEKKKKEGATLFMLNYWRRIKSPFLLLEAFRKVLEEDPAAKLRVGGYGPLWDEMSRWVEEWGLSDSILLLGRLDTEEVALEMKNADAFVHAASYETFSVVCAEAICCGTPVVVSDLPAVREFIDDRNGILVEQEEEWETAMKKVLSIDYDRKAIGENAMDRFSIEEVGARYHRVLSDMKKGWDEAKA